MNCREKCGACCIAPSISSPIPGMPQGKKAGEKCIHLTDDFRCAIFNMEERPDVCSGFMAEEIICGNNRNEALKIISDLELS